MSNEDGEDKGDITRGIEIVLQKVSVPPLIHCTSYAVVIQQQGAGIGSFNRLDRYFIFINLAPVGCGRRRLSWM